MGVILKNALASRSMRWAALGVILGVIEVNWGFVTEQLTPLLGAHAMGWVTIVFGIGAGLYRLVTTTSLADK